MISLGFIQVRNTPLIFIGAACIAIGACSTNATGNKAAAESAAVTVTAAAAVEQPITRFIRVSGTLTAQEEADVAAEIAGRIVATPVERGTAVNTDAELVRIAATEVDAQAKEAQANAAQIEARLGLADGGSFEIEKVPEVANAKASSGIAKNEFDRAKTLFDGKLLSRAEYDQKWMQLEASERQLDVARNSAAQQYQALQAAKARVILAQKALADTVVKAPFTGAVGERFVSVGDYVTKGTKVATVMRINPLRVELTVPEQYVSVVAPGRAVMFEVDAYPGESFKGSVRYVSPSVTASTRALMIEAVVPNDAGRLKPGFFAVARIEEAGEHKAILAPSSAVRTTAGTARVFVINADRVEERIVTTGQVVGNLVEIASGLKAGERVAVSGVDQLVDGVRVTVN